MKLRQKLIEAKGTKPIVLTSKNSDEPSCPICKRYNAMLINDYYDEVWSHKCRDCGHTTINSVVKYDC